MSSKGNPQQPAAVAADGTVPFTPEQIVEHLRMLRQHIPGFGPLDVPDARSLRRIAHVDDALVQAATNTAGASPFVTGAIGKDADAMRTERVDVGRWSAVEDELRTMYQGVAAANLTAVTASVCPRYRRISSPGSSSGSASTPISSRTSRRCAA